MGPQIKKEISIMKIVRHKYVVGMKEVLASRTKIFIVLELVTGGELFDKIVSEGRFSEQMARFYFKQLVEGVEYCHGLGVCHRDLKPENLLLDEQGNLKISDFGLSALYVGDADGDGASRTELLHTTCGTPNYVAPEVLADRGYEGKKADVWSIGVILYVLLAGFLPFDESTIVALFSKIQAADFTYPSWFSPEVKGLLDSILVADPKERVTLTEVRQNPWVTFDDGPNRYHPTPSLNSTVAAARSAALENHGDGNSDDEKPPSSSRNKGRHADEESGQKEATPRESGRRTVPKVPTEKEIEAGVQTAVGHAEDGESGGDSDDGGQDDRREHKTLNAFDLVNQCGGFALDRMFRPRADKVKRTFQFTSHSRPDQLMTGVVG
jgi:serine/threonine protein kinase